MIWIKISLSFDLILKKKKKTSLIIASNDDVILCDVNGIVGQVTYRNSIYTTTTVINMLFIAYLCGSVNQNCESLSLQRERFQYRSCIGSFMISFVGNWTFQKIFFFFIELMFWCIFFKYRSALALDCKCAAHDFIPFIWIYLYAPLNTPQWSQKSVLAFRLGTIMISCKAAVVVIFCNVLTWLEKAWKRQFCKCHDDSRRTMARSFSIGCLIKMMESSGTRKRDNKATSSTTGLRRNQMCVRPVNHPPWHFFL